MKKRLLSILLCLVMVVGLLPASALAKEAEPANLFPYQYQGKNGDMAEKVSHPLVAPNSKYEGSRRNDGLVDYAGNGVLSADIGSADDSGCRGQSYSWSAIGYGDWIYTGLLYNALGQTVQLMDSGLGHKYDPELLPGILNVIFNGDFFTQEADGKTSSGALVKLNVKTGEVKILLSSSSEGNAKHDVSFRNAVEYHGKFYFCGSVDHAPQIWQVDPETDECKKVYGMDVREFYEGFQQHISAGIRGMCVYEDELIISCVTKKANGEFEAQIYSTKTPDDPESFKVIATQAQLFNYPAFHFSDSIYGGSIWEIVKFNNKLYVSICTGTPENMPAENTMQSFAIVCGEKQSDGTWKWHPVVGDKENDNAKYTFGIDPARTCSGAGVLTVLGDHLYIGEYNDEEIALIQIMFNLDFGFMNKNLEQSVNLYRMDEDENIELVVGDKTDMFPEGGISGIGSGFGHNENQYIWRMTVHNNKLYCGTFDTSSLLEPVGQFANGDLALWEPVQWNRLFNYIRELLKLTWDKYGTMPIDEMSSEAQIREDIRELFAFFDSTSLATISDDDTVLPGAGIDAEYDLLADLFGSLPASCFEDGTHADTAIIEALSETFAEDDDAAFYDRIDNDLNGADDVLDDMGVYPDYVDDLESNLEAMQKLAASMKELIQLVKKIVVTAQYMSVAERGCDVYVTEDGVNFETITIDGFGDPFNHGLRVYAETDNGLAFGTANPFYGTQWWLIREDNKPAEVVPKAPVATNIPTAYIVSCVTENSGHGADTMNLIADTFTIGEVTKDGDNYVCPITIATAKYAEAYSVENGKHTAKEESITFNMTWNGKAWEAPEMTQLPVIKVECKATEPEAPVAPVATNIPTAYIVSCVTENSGHGADTMDLIDGTFTIGDVTKDGDNYVCPITIATAKYAEAYSVENGKHTAKEASITFNMTWDGQEWKAPEMTDLPQIKVECKATEPEAPKAPAETALPSAYLVSCTTNDAHADVWMLAIPGADTIGEVTKEGETYICPITVSTKEYAEEYSAATVINKPHTALEETVTYTMTWDGQKWVAPKRADLPVIELKCEATEPEAPKAPEATNIPTAYIVSCVTENSNHGAAQMNLIADTFTIGEVAKEGNNYVCPITIATAKYAEAYSVENGKHTAKEASITFNMTWDGKAWKAPAMTQLPVIELKCETTKPDPKPDPETYTVTVVGSEAAITGAGKYEAGKLVTIDAGMRLGYTFAGWTTQNDVTLANPYSSSTTFTMPAYNVTVTANWRLTPIVPTPSTPSVSNLYPIEILDTTNGAVTSSHKYASAGTTVTLTVNPAAGYTLGSLTAYTSNKVDLKLTDKGEGKYTFTMPASKVFVASVFNPVNGRFVDVPSGSYFEEAVNWAVANGITTGTSATTFDPDGICTRAQAVTFLWRAAGSPAPANSATPFTDVAADSYYAQAVAWAVENGITKGTSDTTFSPDAHCSRAQIVTFLWRAQKSPVVTAANPFADVSVDAYYVNAIQWAVSEGVTTGTSAVTFSPDADCTRAQIVTFIWRALGK